MLQFDVYQYSHNKLVQLIPHEFHSLKDIYKLLEKGSLEIEGLEINEIFYDREAHGEIYLHTSLQEEGRKYQVTYLGEEIGSFIGAPPRLEGYKKHSKSEITIYFNAELKHISKEDIHVYPFDTKTSAKKLEIHHIEVSKNMLSVKIKIDPLEDEVSIGFKESFCVDEDFHLDNISNELLSIFMIGANFQSAEIQDFYIDGLDILELIQISPNSIYIKTTPQITGEKYTVVYKENELKESFTGGFPKVINYKLIHGGLILTFENEIPKLECDKFNISYNKYHSYWGHDSENNIEIRKVEYSDDRKIIFLDTAYYPYEEVYGLFLNGQQIKEYHFEYRVVFEE